VYDAITNDQRGEKAFGFLIRLNMLVERSG
jgi:hypothetical protein